MSQQPPYPDAPKLLQELKALYKQMHWKEKAAITGVLRSHAVEVKDALAGD